MDKKLNCILLVDDDKATNFLNKRLLTRMNVTHNIQIARNGVEAEEYLKKSAEKEPGFPKPDLIFLDINMPLVNGWEFLSRYESLPDNFKSSILILMLTTSLREVDAERAKSVPFIRGLIYKPLTESEIRNAIVKHFA
jgi:CheY-like chemotaxis protein